MNKSVDWTLIIRDLLENQTQVELSRKTGVHQSVISDLFRGLLKPNLSYAYGKALKDAHDELIQKTNVPEET